MKISDNILESSKLNLLSGELRIESGKMNAIAGFFKDSLRSLVRELDLYIKKSRDIPWWYNERPCVSFYANGVCRNMNEAVVLEEFRSRTDSGSLGRADLYICHKNRHILVEGKKALCNINDESGDWSNTWESAALRQAQRYSGDFKYDCLMSLCFTTLYCNRKNLRQTLTRLQSNSWSNCRLAVERGLDFCGFVHIKDIKTIEKIALLSNNPRNTYCYFACLITGMIAAVNKEGR